MAKTTKIVDSLDKIVIRLHRHGNRVGSLYKPNATKRKNMMGRVLQTGSSCYPKGFNGYRIKPGDEVIFDNWGALRECFWSGENRYFIKPERCVAIVIRPEGEGTDE